MATQPLTKPIAMSVEEYVATVFRPDCDYVDGEIEERNLGERDHSRLQKRFIKILAALEDQLGMEVFPGQRVRTSPTRFRIPDVCVVLGEANEQIFRQPPFLCIEVMSPEDRLGRVRQRVDDYLKMGVPYVWVADPQTKTAYHITRAEGWREVMDGVLRTANPTIEVPLNEIFG